MIKAKKSALFETIFLAYTRNLFRRRFRRLNLLGLENLRERERDLPLVLYANHSSWFDPLAAFVVSKEAGLDAFAMMEEKNLAKLPFFRRIGAFSVVRENPREAVKSLNYAADLLLAKPNRAVWIFPQGAIQPNDRRPLRLYNGTAKLIEKCGTALAAPVAMRFEFLIDFKPEAFVQVGQLEKFSNIADVKKLTNHLAANLTNTLDELKNRIINS
jgi:chlorobactene lauroyltransferase